MVAVLGCISLFHIARLLLRRALPRQIPRRPQPRQLQIRQRHHYNNIWGLSPRVCVKPWCSRPDIGLQYVRILLCVMPFHCFHIRLTAALKAVASHVCIRSPRAGSVVVGVGTVVLPLLCDADKTGSIVSRKQTSVGHKTTHTTTQRVYAWHVLVHCAS